MNENEIKIIIDKMNELKQKINLLNIIKLSRKSLIDLLQINNSYSRKKLQDIYLTNLLKEYNCLEEKLCMVNNIDFIKKYDIRICDYHLESLCCDGKLELIKYYVENVKKFDIDINHVEFALLGKQLEVLVYLINKLNPNINLYNLYINDDTEQWLKSLDKQYNYIIDKFNFNKY